MSDSSAMAIDIHALIERAGGVGKAAAALNVSHPTICDWKKSGFVPGSRVVQISHALGVSIEDVSKLVKPAARRSPRIEQCLSSAAE
jgi:DNA-binding transcriptional regulator YdaS (Cro superfamily)